MLGGIAMPKLFLYCMIAFAVLATTAFAAPSTVTRSFSNATPAQCSNLTVSLGVVVNSTDTYYAIDEVFPAGWTVTNAGTGSTAQAGHIKWVVITGAVNTTYSYDVGVPCAATGINTFSGTYGFGINPIQPIAGPTSVTVSPGVDTTPPVVTIISPTNTTITASTPALNFITVDAGGVDLTKCAYVLDAGTKTALPSCANITLPTLANGAHTVTVYSNDTSNNQGSASVSFTVNFVPPVLNPSTVTRNFSNASPAQCSNLTVNLSVFVNSTDTYYAIDEVFPAGWTVTNAGTGNTATTGHIKWVVITGAVNTTYSYDVGVPCAASGIASFTGTYGFGTSAIQTILGSTSVNVVAAADTTAPAVTLISPTNTTYTASLAVLNFTTVDNVAVDLAKCAYVLDAGTKTALPSCANTTLTGLANGAHTVTVYSNDTSNNQGSASVSFTVNVAVPVLTTITLSPQTPSVTLGNTQQFTATTFDQFGAPMTATIAWSSGNTSVGTIDPATGLFTAAAVGTSTITATSGAMNNSTVVTVTAIPPVLASIALSPLAPSIVAGSTQQFTATPLDQFGAPIVATLAWTSSNTSVGIVNSTGYFTSSLDGTTTINVSSVAVINSTVVTVTVPASVTFTITSSAGINGTISPLGTTIVPSGASQAYTITPNTGFTVSSVLVDTVSVGAVTNYTFTNVTANHTISASFAAIPPVLTTITLSPQTPSVTLGNTQQFTATTFDQFGSPMTATIAWSSGNTSVGTIDSTGLLTSIAAGTTTITAASGAVNNSTTATVTLQIDTVAPTTTATAVNSSNASYSFGNWTSSLYVNVTLSCTDSGTPTSGCNVTSYCTDTANTCVPNMTYAVPVQISTSGVSYIRYASTDNAGNTELAISQAIDIDTIAPVVSIISPVNTTYTTSTPELNFTVADTESGVDLTKCAYSIDSSLNITIPNCGNIKLPSMINGNHILTMYSNDMVGNVGSASVSFSTNSPTTQGNIIIIKNTVNSDGTFSFTITGPNSSTPTVTTSGGIGSTGPIVVDNGTYSVSETVPSGWTMTSSNCTSFNLSTDTITCVFNNTKNVVSSNVGGGGGGGGFVIIPPKTNNTSTTSPVVPTPAPTAVPTPSPSPQPVQNTTTTTEVPSASANNNSPPTGFVTVLTDNAPIVIIFIVIGTAVVIYYIRKRRINGV
jgi:uncharacterized protein YjdB